VNLIIEVGWTRIDGLQIMCMLSFQGFVFVRTRKYVFFQSPTFPLHDHLFLINTTHKNLSSSSSMYNND